MHNHNNSPFRNKMNVRLKKDLFFETTPDKTNVMYTLKEADHLGYVSIFRVYQELEDPTEYKIATEYFDGVEHWELLCKEKWFQPYLNKMRRSLELKIKARMFSVLAQDAQSSESKTSTVSAKYLLEKGYDQVSPDRRKAGRPSKQEIAEAAQDELELNQLFKEDYNRILGVAQ